jgi:hypothetical protein
MARYAMALESGEIIQVTEGPYLYIPCDETVSDETHYVDTTQETVQIFKKQELDITYITNGLETLFTQLPINTLVKSEGLSVISDEQGVTIEFEIPGTYKIEFQPPPSYATKRMEVTVG